MAIGAAWLQGGCCTKVPASTHHKPVWSKRVHESFFNNQLESQVPTLILWSQKITSPIQAGNGRIIMEETDVKHFLIRGYQV